MQDYGKFGVTAMEDKQKLFRLIKRLNSAAGSADRRAPEAPAARPPPACSDKAPPFHTNPVGTQQETCYGTSPDLLNNRDNFFDGNAGLLDLNAHDGDLLSPCETTSHHEPPPRGPAVQEDEADFLGPPSSQPQYNAQALEALENTNPPKIRVVVRKRPLNKKEIDRADEDIVNVMGPTALQVNETKVKVDLTKYVEKHMFSFDDALDEFVSNDDVYRCTVQPLVGTLFRGGKATCFAYGQTGSGKTYTMSPLPIRAGTELISALRLPKHSECQLWVSNFEIYGGKVFDLLNTRKKLDIREDGKKQVCIVGLKEHFVEEPAEIQQLIEHGAGARSTGSTGANEDSSRSHSIVQFAVKGPGKTGKLRLVGKLSFIDLAGSERGADTYDNDKQTRLEGAEINKSLLALKECIRALDLDKTHVPFRGSKLTEVLRDSFVGKEARTVMIANISPNSTSVEHTLNTLRYADRVKELRKDKQERAAGGVTPGNMGYGRQAAGASTNSRPSSAAQQRPQNQAPLPPVPETGKQVGGSGPRGVVVDTRQQQAANPSREDVPEEDCLLFQREELISSIMQEEDDLIAAHRQQIEETMELVRKEMNLLSEVDQPGSRIDSYVSSLAAILSQKAESTARLQQQLSSFVRKLKEEESMQGR